MALQIAKSIGVAGSKAGCGKRKMTLEDYLSFLHTRNHDLLTLNSLNQIILMHGFVRIHAQPKKFLIDAVKTISLMDPCRSTLNEEIRPCSSDSVCEWIKDIEELNWQECSVSSIQTLSSRINGDANASLSTAAAAATESVKEKPRRKRKRKSSKSLENPKPNQSVDSTSTTSTLLLECR
ncbi:hypothetical protein RJ641_016334 [Dillenia turbinata]|uniref:DUF7787 domain-containing protein n=1 Tax=Dillenia turbinata TaxID=194707 RepID=A0AAN8YYS2_9MAGN